MNLSCNIVDIGARYGIHPSFKKLIGLAEFDLFEMDREEAARLDDLYAAYDNIRVHAKALFSSNGQVKFNRRKHKGLYSLLNNNQDFIEMNNYMVDAFEYLDDMVVPTVTMDSYLQDRNPHIIKIDAEGAELEILKGATDKLNASVLAVRAEVYFHDVYQNGPLFGDVHQFLIKNNFELINLEYDGKGHCLNAFTLHDKYGKLIGSDGIWVKKTDSLYARNEKDLLNEVIVIALFLLLNNATDVGIDLLLQVMERHKIGFGPVLQDPVFLQLKREIAFLFKKLMSLPAPDKSLIHATYENIFEEEFPDLSNFYSIFFL